MHSEDENIKKVPVLTRAQLIDDAFHLIVAGQLDSVIFWQLSKALMKEKDYIVWYPMFKAFEYMSSILPLSEVQEIKVNNNKFLQ